MKSALEAIGLISVVLGLQVVSAAWWVLKMFFGFFVVAGAVSQILGGFKFSGSEGLTWYAGAFQESVNLGLQFMDNWMAVAVLVLMFWVLSARRAIALMATDASHTKIAIIAAMNYLELEVRTDGMKLLADKGFSQFLKEAFWLNVWGTILGRRSQMTDDALTARAVRQGTVITLKQDLEDWRRNQS